MKLGLRTVGDAFRLGTLQPHVVGLVEVAGGRGGPHPGGKHEEVVLWCVSLQDP